MTSLWAVMYGLFNCHPYITIFICDNFFGMFVLLALPFPVELLQMVSLEPKKIDLALKRIGLQVYCLRLQFINYFVNLLMAPTFSFTSVACGDVSKIVIFPGRPSRSTCSFKDFRACACTE